MRACLLLGLIAAACVALTLAPQVHADEPLRVMTFNVRVPVASDGPNRWKNRRNLMAETIRQAHPDVFGTQELHKRQGDYLVGKLPRYRWFGEGRRGGDGDEHMGVFYRTDRLTVEQSGNFWLSDTPRVPGSISWGQPYPRMVTWALFRVKASGRQFYYFNTHFPYRAQDEQARTHSAREIVARLKQLPPNVPVVLTGDFNTTPAAPAHAILTAQLHDARLTAPTTDGPSATFHNFTGIPDRRIDWILYRGFTPIAEHTLTNHVDGHYPSDHFPVLAQLAWQSPSKNRPTHPAPRYQPH